MTQTWTDEPTAELTPVHTAYLTRDREQVWIHVYRDPRMVVLTYPRVELDDHPQGEMPGLVREIPIGPRANPQERYVTEIERLISQGWQDRSVTVGHVWTDDPWALPPVLDGPAPF